GGGGGGGVHHPCLIEVYDCGRTEEGLLYMALEYISGLSLSQVLEQSPRLPVGRAARIGAGVLAGVGAAHRAGIVHRDLKPANILLATGEKPKVVDFGIAKVFTSSKSTMTGAYVGTPMYTSPEQALGQPIGPAADQYA